MRRFTKISMQNDQFKERKAQLKAHEERYRVETFQHLTFLQKAFNNLKVQEGLQATLEERERRLAIFKEKYGIT
jgi:hypothetical protein